MHPIFNALRHPLRTRQAFRLVILGVLSLALGLALDWFRPQQRLVFPRPLPVFKVIPSAS